ncbi:unnamed protein product, partial [Iphiclides podalirius]
MRVSTLELTPVMYTDIPTVTRCCFCVPLRFGLMLLAYLSLLANVSLLVLALGLLFVILVLNESSVYTAVTIFTITLLVADVAFTIILIVGAQQRKISLLRLYNRYGIACVALIMVLGLICIVYEVSFTTRSLMNKWEILITGSSFAAAILILHIYLLLLTHSIIVKMKSSCQFRFVNHTSDPECFLQPSYEEGK